MKVAEGERTRVQAYEGVCIARSGQGLNENFTVRKISYGEGVERVFPVYSPMINSVKVVRRGKVRRAKLYYLRDRRGKSARIAERVEPPAPRRLRQGVRQGIGWTPNPSFASKQGRRQSRRLFCLRSMTNESSGIRPGRRVVRRRGRRARRRSRSTPPIAIARPWASSSNPAPSCACRSAPASRPASSGRRAPPAATTSNPSPRPSTGRRSVRRCATSSIGRRAGRWRRAACCCGWRSAPARSPTPPAPKFGVVATGKPPTRMTEARARVLAALAENGAPTPKAALAARAGCSTSVIDGLIADGALEAVALAPESGAAPLDPDFRPTRLNADQRAAADDLTRLVADRAFSATLLEGVTGSGKTEVYFEAVAETLRQKRQALVLLPEIALTAQFLDRFAARFRRKAGRMAFRPDRAPARARLDGGRERRGVSHRRRALGALSSVRRSRPHRRRRGARGRLQARGRRHLQCAGHGGRPRAVREGADRARLGDAGDRDPVQRRERTLPLAQTSFALRPGAAARHRLGRS